MNREDDFSISELRRKREQQAVVPAPQPPHANLGPVPSAHSFAQQQPVPPTRSARAGAEEAEEEQGEFHVDTGRMLAAVQRRWWWLLVAAVLLGGAGLAGGYHKGRYNTTVTLTRFEGGPLSAGTLKSMLQDWQLVRRVADKSQPHIDAERLMARLIVDDEAKTERIHIRLEGQDTPALVTLANLFANEAVAYSKDEQLRDPLARIPFWREKISKYRADIKAAETAFLAFQAASGIVDPDAEAADMSKQLGELKTVIEQREVELALAGLNQQNPLIDRLAALKLKRETDFASFTDNHPSVQSLLAEMQQVENKIAAMTNAANLPTQGKREAEIAKLKERRTELELTNAKLPEIKSQYATLKSELDALRENQRRAGETVKLLNDEVEQAKGFFRVNAPVTAEDVDTRGRMKKAVSFGTKGALAGIVLAVALVLLVELKDRTMKTTAEVERATGLRVLASLGDLDKMTPEARDKWAFRTWTILAGQLTASANHGMVCGFVSSGQGEGRSTWIKLLGEAASKRGLRVLTVATKPSGTDEASAEAETVANEKSFTDAVEEAMSEKQAVDAEAEAEAEAAGELAPAEQVLTLSPSALAFPAEVTQRFTSGGLPAAHIPLPGWVWNIDRRRQWQMALAHWRGIDNLVLLVELPPAAVPESVLLAESLPQIIWLVDSGKASIRDTKEQLEMMRHAKCHLVGTVLNHEPNPLIKL